MSDTPNPPQGSEESKSGPTPGDSNQPQPTADSTVPATGAEAQTTPDPADVEKNKTMALLSYISILWLVPLLAAKDSPYAKYHCNQGILLTLVAIVASMVLGFASLVLGFIPFIKVIAGCMTCIVFPLFWVAIMAYAVIGIMNALGGKMKPLPFFPVVTWIK